MNNYFQFKQFRIEQGNTAMKVCTDSCILGAYAQPQPQVRSVLDIGTGTGLLSLMLAQRIYTNTSENETLIDAVEIDLAAYAQANDNVANSPWANHIALHHSTIQAYAKNCPIQYDFIITNPPFFEAHLKTTNKAQNQALHSESLSFDELLEAIDKLLNLDGVLVVLLPLYQMQVFAQKARQKDLVVVEQLRIHNHPKKRDFRMICHFTRKGGKQSGQVLEKELFIRDATQQYTPEFVALLKDYYLKL